MPSPFMPGRPRVWREEDGVKSLPKAWGAYRFKEGSYIDYIGIASNLYNRVSWHRSQRIYYNPEIHSIEYQIAQMGISWDDMREWEIRKIKQHSPGLVTYAGGNGKRPAIEINGELIEPRGDESFEDAIIRKGFFDVLTDFWRNLL